MKKITLFKLLCLFLVPLSLLAQKREEMAKAEQYLQSKGEVIIEFTATSTSQLAELAKVVSLSHKHVDETDLHAEAYANRNQFERFLEYGLPFHVDPAENEIPADFHNTTMATAAWDDTWNAYPTYSQYEAKMQYWATTYPTLCTLQVIGTLSTGRKLLVLKISDNAPTDESEPEFLYTSSMHGDEITGYPLMMRLIDQLLTNYGSNSEITSIVNGTEIFICPLANPNGSYRSAANNIFASTGNTPTRGNANSIDLNRNYPDPVDGIHPDNNAFQPETLAFLAFERTRNFVLAANYHGGAEVFNFPWDTWPVGAGNVHPHDTYFKLIATEYAQLCQTADNNLNYMDDVFGTGQFAGTTNGSVWYTISGGRQDYNNYFNHNKESTIEVSATKTPSASNLPTFWTKNRQAILNYMKRAAYGLHGVVTDAEGRPLHAKVYSSADLLGSWVETSPTVGDYHKVFKAGTYSVTFMVPGYTSQTHSVTVTDTGTTTLNITMLRSSPLPTAPDVTSCTGKSAALTATGTGVMSWYDTATSSTVLATGNTFNTPELVSGRSYFVEQLITNVPAGPSAPEGTASSLVGHSVVFSTSQPMKLRTVSVTASTAGQVWVELQNSAGAMVESKVVLIPAGGTQDIDLDFFIPAGTGHRLVTKELSGLTLITKTNYSLTTPQVFGNVTLTGYNGGNQLQFFNWQFAPHLSNRDEVVVTITPNPVLATINPTNKIVATGAFTLTVNGSNFRNGESIVRWNGSDRSTTFVSSTQLTAAITAADVQTGGIKNVTVYNNCNETATAAQSFTVNCVAPVPNITNLPTLTAQCSLSVTAPTATSSCYGIITGTTPSPLNYSTDGTYQITWTYTDVDGKTASQNQTVIIDDTVAPVPNIASLSTITAQCSATVTAPTATDACAGTIVATTSSQTSFTSDGSYIVTWNYDDNRGNISSQQQTIIIDDTIAPVPTVSSLNSVTALCNATVTAPTATDSCGGLITGTTANPTTYTTPGNYTIVWSYNDGRGNSITQNQSVTITAPQVTLTPGSVVCPNSVVMVTATGASSYSWSSDVPNTLFTNAAATTSYTGSNLSTIYLKTPSTATVTVTGNGGPGCATTASSVYNVGTTWNGTAWSNGLPSALTSATFTGNYVSSGNVAACTVIVNNGATVTIAPGHDLEVAGPVTVAPGSQLVISNSANLLQDLQNNSNTGSIVVKRNAMMRRLDYVYWASPVAGQNLKLFSPLTVSPPVGSTRFYDINEATNAYVGLDPLLTTMQPAKGYVVRAPNTWPVNGSQQLFDGQFTGIPNTGTYQIPVTAFGNAFNLIGNPYPSTVDCELFIEANPGTMYFWTHNSQVAGAPNYATYNAAGGVAAFAGGVQPNGFLQIGQGFLHKVPAPSIVVFNNTMRTGNNSGQFFRTTIGEKHRLWLNLETPAESLNQILIGYMTGATESVDTSIDGRQYETSGSSLYSLIAGEAYAIQGRSLPFTTADVVKLGFKAAAPGSFSISLAQLDGLFAEGQPVYIKDHFTGITHQLSSAYTFVSEAGTYNDRFEIVFLSSPLDVQNPDLLSNDVIVYNNSSILTIESGAKPIAKVQIYDIRGRLIYERSNINENVVRLTDLRAEQQVLISKIIFTDQTRVNRKVAY